MKNLSRLLTSLALVACVACDGTSKSAASNAAASDPPAEEPEEVEYHVHDAPHGGLLCELGDHFANIEFLIVPGTGVLRAWVLDAHAHGSIRIPDRQLMVALELASGERLDLVLDAQASNLTGETPGDSSAFEGRSEKLRGQQQFQLFMPTFFVKGTQVGPIHKRYPSGEDVAN